MLPQVGHFPASLSPEHTLQPTVMICTSTIYNYCSLRMQHTAVHCTSTDTCKLLASNTHNQNHVKIFNKNNAMKQMTNLDHLLWTLVLVSHSHSHSCLFCGSFLLYLSTVVYGITDSMCTLITKKTNKKQLKTVLLGHMKLRGRYFTELNH